MLRAAALNMLTALMGQYSVGVSLLFVAPKTLLSANLLQLQPPASSYHPHVRLHRTTHHSSLVHSLSRSHAHNPLASLPSSN